MLSEPPEAASSAFQNPSGPAVSPQAAAAGGAPIHRRPDPGSADWHPARGHPQAELLSPKAYLPSAWLAAWSRPKGCVAAAALRPPDSRGSHARKRV